VGPVVTGRRSLGGVHCCRARGELVGVMRIVVGSVASDVCE
jgi:hypothetical protein